MGATLVDRKALQELPSKELILRAEEAKPGQVWRWVVGSDQERTETGQAASQENRSFKQKLCPCS